MLSWLWEPQAEWGARIQSTSPAFGGGGTLGKVVNHSVSATCEMVTAVPISQGGYANSVRCFLSHLSPVSWLCQDFKWKDGI